MKELFTGKTPGVYEAYERGEIDEDELWRTYFADGRAVDVKKVRTFLEDGYDYVTGMRSMLGELDRIDGVEVYAFSNYGKLYEVIEAKLELSRFLDWRFVSCDTGLRKPDPAAYAHALASLGADPARDAVVFVDDSDTNCAAAAAAGLRAIRFNGDSADCRTGLIAEGLWELRV